MTNTLKIYRIVYRTTLCYLLLPLVIWAAFWLKPAWAVVSTGLFIGSGVIVWRHLEQIQLEEDESPKFDWKSYLWIVTPLLFLSLISGLGGLGPQGNDWQKHNAIIYDLSTRQWPVIYDDWKGDFGVQRPYLAFYSAYYLPATLVSKLFINSFEVANWLLLFWTQIALCLTAFWLQIIVRPAKWWLGFAFCFIGNFDDWVGTVFGMFHMPEYVNRLIFPMPSTVTWLAWVPHHAVAAWVGTPFLLVHLFRQRWNCSLPILTFWWFVLFVWSPFVAIGAIPWLLLAFYRQKNEAISRISGAWLALTTISGIFLWGLYFSQRVPAVEAAGEFAENAFLPLEYIQWMNDWKTGLATFFVRYGLAVVLAWGIPCLVLLALNAKYKVQIHKNEDVDVFIAQNGKTILLTACITIFSFGLFRGGIDNDMFMRGSITSYLVLFCLACWLGTHVKISKNKKLVLLFCLLAMAKHPTFEAFSKFKRIAKEKRAIYRPQSEKILSLTNSEIQPAVRRQQYLGLPDSIFARYFLRDDQKK